MNQREILENKNTTAKIKNTFDGLSKIREKKESVILKAGQQKHSKLKCKQKKNDENRTSETCGKTIKGVIYE